ncbi:MAG: PTS sugar transporter subunit IIA [Solobacterium sp.]|jgi:PTS system N-acetylgalactosamine-specific IIA component|nr:PTS sugar transporter subunit IIA [Solobacterium sp.]MCH4206462.1 PTS sugar transporter subunit IIA [Solobacterium sp.]MCH4227968.1 PTS sugar transporter subunit IIA [Solobacterium sp.]MCH4283390.1 PTS sugar transporter subunit IIA [Solobacterium sp.]
MIGIVVTGHGNFGTGLASSVKLIAGEPEKFIPVDFVEGMSSEDLEAKYRDAFEQLKDCEGGILVFTDLIGGSPFKISAELSVTLADAYHIAILSGTNLGMLIEASMSRQFADDADALADSIVNTGKDQVIHYVYQAKDETEEEPSEGI